MPALAFYLDLLVWITCFCILLPPVVAVGLRIQRGEIRLQFGIYALFVVVTVAAVAFGIARLPAPWPLKAGLIFALLLCAYGVGVAARQRNPKIGVKNKPLF